MSRISIIKVVLCFLLIIVNGCIPALSSQYVAESDHPYKNDPNYKWIITKPDAAKIQLHFKYLKLANGPNDWGIGGDKLIILDKHDNVLETFEGPKGISLNKDFWTKWYWVDTLQIKLVTDNEGYDEGFIIDKYIASNETLPIESDHPYKNDPNYKWTISEPDAAKIKLHFQYLKLANGPDAWGIGGDKLIISDKNGNVLETFKDSKDNREDFWTNWYLGDKLTVELITDYEGYDEGFIIDKDEIGSNETNYSGNTENSKSTLTPSNDNVIDKNKVLTTTELTSSANPSPLGQSVTLVAKVDTPSQGTEEPLGTVTFMDGTTPIGTADLISGQATLNTSSLSVGSHSVTAIYSGDDIKFKSSTSSPFTLKVPEQPNTEEPSSTKNHPNTEQPANSEDKSNTEQKSLVGNIIDLVSQNSLISTIVGGIILLFIEILIKGELQ